MSSVENCLPLAAKNWTGNRYKWTVLIGNRFVAVTQSFAKRINEAPVRAILSGFALNGQKKRVRIVGC